MPFNAGNLKNELYRLDVVEQEGYAESGHEILTLRLPADKLQQLLGQSDIDPFEVLPADQAELLIPKLEPFEKELKQDSDQALLAEDELLDNLLEDELLQDDLLDEDMDIDEDSMPIIEQQSDLN